MTTRADIARWFDRGKVDGSTHLIVVCDTFDHDDHLVFAESDADCLEQYAEHNGKNMQRVMEVYDLREDRAAQLAERRAFHLPAPVAPQEEERK